MFDWHKKKSLYVLFTNIYEFITNFISIPIQLIIDLNFKFKYMNHPNFYQNKNNLSLKILNLFFIAYDCP